ncbi:pseudouridine synthase [Alkalimarinus alittae]|uniref:Pseudouridine synthase n=1 Tax=Alkalimarinus alittae TaxID=2961619 RepID=A0ABY6N770_9ALTE|nr:pseudouridine synthase [Alkalimarinus alittae]UZE97934.1 pseudouridine synthase [Alkalimarinus alittae]
MALLILLNKPFNVLSQFTDDNNRTTLANYIDTKGVYAAGRLDYDSEGLLLLTDNGVLQHKITDPKHKLPKTYWVQVEGRPTEDDISTLKTGVLLKDGKTAPAKAKIIPAPNLWDRVPPIRERKNDITTWISLTITEGRNRQVRRMTAAIGFPTLRLVRYSIGSWSIDHLNSGEHTTTIINMPANAPQKKQSAKPPHKSKTHRKKTTSRR